MVESNELLSILNRLNDTMDITRIRETTGLLLSMHRNIWFHEDDTQYRKIKIRNHEFQKKVWNIPAAREFMLKGGWFEIAEFLIFNEDVNLPAILSAIMEHRDGSPKEREWITPAKVAEVRKHAIHKAEELRKKVAEKRQKELDEIKKEKAKKEALTADLRAKIKADKMERRKKDGMRQSTRGAKAEKQANLSQQKDPNEK